MASFCAEDACDRMAVARSLCGKHYAARWRSGTHLGLPLADPNRPRSRRQVGERWVLQSGYAWIKASDGRHYAEHRFVMEQILGRPLAPGENVHHINGVRSDNRPENLELWFKAQPGGQRVDDLIAYLVTYHADTIRERL